MGCNFYQINPMPAIDIKRWMSPLLAQLEESRQRQLVSLQGPREWCLEQLESLFALEPDRLLIAERGKGEFDLPMRRARGWLGSEARLVALDLFDGLDPDALCIAAGLVRAGGILLLLSPSPERWDLTRDRYARWQGQDRSPRASFVDYFFAAVAEADAGVIRLTPETRVCQIPQQPKLTPTPMQRGLTADQADALQRIERWYAQGQHGVLLMSAERGRGKSYCLGALCARLRTSRNLRILLSAGSRRAAARVLQVAPDTEFVAPDRLLLLRPPADLVIIDEAAMIPLSLLHQIREVYPRVVLATTSGGYEGTGQGFMLRFVASLQAHELQQVGLTQPVRWCVGDALESWIDRVLMLNPAMPAASPHPPKSLPASESIGYRLLAKPGAVAERETIRQVYALLSSAHYRTRPSDLRMLMENPAQRLFVACIGERVIGAVLLNLEGGFAAELCHEVYLGRRRPRGHLLAQMLTAQAGIENFALERGLRIVRIAVSEEYRRRGIASRMLDRAKALALESGCAWLGASFALEAETTAFWRRNGFALAHVSFAAGKSSGAHSIAVICALTPPVEAVIERLQRRIGRQLRIWLTQYLQSLDAEQVTALLRYSGYRAELDADERAEVEAFVDGHRGFEFCFASLQQFVMHAIAQSEIEADRLLIEKAVQNRSWNHLPRGTGSDGRRQLQQRLRRLVEPLRKD